MRYYLVGEFGHPEAAEWFPVFTTTLYHSLSQTLPDIQKSTVLKVTGTVRYHKVLEVPYNIVITSNTVWLFDLESKKVIGFTTHDNLEELLIEGRQFIEDFDVTVYTGDYNPLRVEAFKNLFQHYKKDFEIKPWRYTTHKWKQPEGVYGPENGKLFFRGYPIEIQRAFLKILQERKIKDIDIDFVEKLPPLEFYNKCRTSLACLSASGVVDMCNRDIELFSLGAPMIRPRFSSNFDVAIPDDVYIPIEFEQNNDELNSMPIRGRWFPLYSEKLADDVLYTWNQVKTDKELLNKVSKNAREFYLEYFTNEKILEITLRNIKTELKI